MCRGQMNFYYIFFTTNITPYSIARPKVPTILCQLIGKLLLDYLCNKLLVCCCY